MTNASLLEHYIQKSGLKKTFLANALGISRYGLALKLQNKSEFRASQIDILCNLLDIDVENRMAIFFAE